MNYDRVIGRAFSTVWRFKSLWVLGSLGVALVALGSGLSIAFQLNWQSDFQSRMFSDLSRFGSPMTPDQAETFVWQTMRSMLGMYLLAGLAGVLALFGYLISLVTRGAIIDQASRAERASAVDWRYGLRIGLSRGPVLFVIDLAWLVPAAIVFGGLAACGLAGILGSTAVAANADRAPDVSPLAFMWALAGFACLWGLFGLLYGLVSALFAPMMVQHAVQRPAGPLESIRAGWRIASANLGNMIILLVVSFLLSIALGAVTWVFSFGLSAVGLGFAFTPGLSDIAGPFRLGLLLLGGFLYALIYTVAAGFVEAVRLTIYTFAYIDLTGSRAVRVA